MKLKNLILAALGVSALALAFTSCKKDDSIVAGPTMKLMDASKTPAVQIQEYAGPAQQAQIYVIPGKNRTVKSLSYIIKGKNGEQQATATPSKDLSLEKLSGNNENAKFAKLDFAPDASWTDVSIEFTATDNKGVKSTFSVKYKPAGAAVTPPANEKAAFGAEKAGNEINNLTGAKNGAFDLKNGQNLAKSANQADKYMINLSTQAGWVSGFTSGTAPGLSTDNKGNGTLFKKVTGDVDYATVTPEDAAEKMKDGTSEKIETVAENDLIIAKKDKEIYILKITKVVDGTVTFSYKSAMLK